MAKIAVFDSGLGSLSIINPLRRLFSADVAYLADSASFPYGSKSKSELAHIIKNTIASLESRFAPDVIVMASNTPSLILDISHPKLVTVKPPLLEAKRSTRTKNIGILATTAAVQSKELDDFIGSREHYQVFKLDASNLVDLVESAKFLTDVPSCKKEIKRLPLTRHNIDTVTLSSTHLPFLKPLLQAEFPNVRFLDPAVQVARLICEKVKVQSESRLEIFTTGDPGMLSEKLTRLGIKDTVHSF